MKSPFSLYTIYRQGRHYGICNPFGEVKVEPIYDFIEVKSVEQGCYLLFRLVDKFGLIFIPSATERSLTALIGSGVEGNRAQFARLEESISWRFSSIYDAVEEHTTHLTLNHGSYDLYFGFDANRIFTVFEWRRQRHLQELKSCDSEVYYPGQ